MFQKRKDGLQNFNRNWSSYENGFGESDSDYWLGLHRIYSMMKDQSQILRVDLQDWENNSRYAEYGDFSIGSKDVEYQIKIGRKSYSGGKLYWKSISCPLPLNNTYEKRGQGICSSLPLP